MNRNWVSGLILFLILSLISCTSPSGPLPGTTPSPLPGSDPSTTETLPARATLTPVPEKDPAGPELFALAERGPYWTGNRSYTLADPDRSGREIRITVHYPAIIEYNSENNPITRDAAPDLSGAPYPLILTGPNSGDLLFKSHLASQGFVMVIVRPPGFSYDDDWGNIVIDAPLDFLFTLDQLSASPPDELASLLDTDRVGIAGYSWDGFFSLALGGARIDSQYYLSQCAQAPSLQPPISPGMFDYYCGLAANWEPFVLNAGDLTTSSGDGLWQPLTDDRILAVMPMAPDGAWLYGERGLSAVNIPALIITGTSDDLASYTMETAYIFEHLGSPERYLISFINEGHMMVFNSGVQQQMNHFAAAFFGYYLQGNEGYQAYFSEDFINQFNNLYWGIYPR